MVCKVFISHAFEQTALFDSLVTRMNKARFDWIDCSVPRNRRFGAGDKPLPEDEMQRLLTTCIDDCDVFVVIAKPVVSHREWLQWEIQYAKSIGKPILAVWRRQVDKRVSQYALQRASRTVDTWHIGSITRTIEEMVRETRANERPLRNNEVSVPPPEIEARLSSEETVEPQVTGVSEPLAPVEELALAPGEQVIAESQRPGGNQAPAAAVARDPSKLRIPLAEILRSTGTANVQTPRELIAEREPKRRWWQFWKAHESDAAKSN